MALMIPIVPVLGAAIARLLSSSPLAVKWTAGSVTVVTLVGWLVTCETLASFPSILGLLFTVIAAVSVLGQQPERDRPHAEPIILLLLGLSLGVLRADSVIARWLLAAFLVATAVAVWRAGRLDALRIGTIVSLAVGACALPASLMTSGPPATVLLLVGCAVLLPLFPLQGGFVGSLSSLPGALPAFLAVVLPCLGWHALATAGQDVPPLVRESLVPIAIVSGMMAVIRAVAQVQLARLLASITVALLAAVWWCLGTIGTAAPAAWYVPAVAIAASGLLLGAHLLDVRYGVRDVENLGGLARTMPRFAMLLGLLFMAAMGLPLFGVFSAFMTMVFVPSLSAPSLFLVLLVWFIASLFLLKVWHRVFYGPPRTDLLYHDLTLLESVPFIALVLLLLTAGPFSSVLTPQSGATTVATAKAAPP